jgi:hypothetical protein
MGSGMGWDVTRSEAPALGIDRGARRRGRGQVEPSGRAGSQEVKLNLKLKPTLGGLGVG